MAANAVAVPITGFWIMPWAIVACLLMPFGLEHLALAPMSWGIDLVAAIAHEVTAWPGAVLHVPSMPAPGLMLLGLGGLWLCIWLTPWRWLGVLPMAAGALTLAVDRPPDLLISGDSRLVAVRAADGAYLPSTSRAQLAEETWTRRAAASLGPVWPAAGESGDGLLSCDAARCLYRARGRVVALLRNPTALAAACRDADLVVSPEPTHRLCRGPRIIDRFDTWRNGGYAVWLDSDDIRVETVKQWQGNRPWVPKRPQ